MHFYNTFDEVDRLLKSIGVLVAVIKNVSSKSDALNPPASLCHVVVHIVDSV